MVSALFESAAHVPGAVSPRCVECLKRRAGLKFTELSGPWTHEAASMYARSGRRPFDACGYSARGPFVVVRDPVDRFFSLVGYFLRPPYIKDPGNLSLARRLVAEPGNATPALAVEVLDMYDWRFPH